jgi:WD40 repeat protein
MKSIRRNKWFLITTGLVIVLALVLVFVVYGSNPFLVSTYTRQTNVVESVAWSPDGKYIASASGNSAQVWKAP